MRKVLTIALATTLFACNTSGGPKETAKEFTQALYILDYQKAASLATADSKSIIDQKEVQPLNTGERSIAMIKESLLLDSLSETISGNDAEVKNNMLHLSVKKDGGVWKVVATPEVIDQIINRKEKVEALKLKWNVLQNIYSRRNEDAKAYISILKQKGTLSENARTLEALINGSQLKELTGKNLLAYVMQQDQITALIDKTVEPSFAANSDMATNYIIQLNLASSNIAAAKNEYNSTAQVTRSHIYVPVD
ncbi:MAG TPA: hypothetical protein VM368_06470 [Flavisolibacter sp.]|nr:hypothetical protein [Flavisolibacter sp.]